MEVDAALRQRRSMRAFRPEPVTEDAVRDILDVARRAPSGGNIQPWKVVAVAGPARAAVTALAFEVLARHPEGETDDPPIYPKPLGEPYRARRRKVGEDMYAALGIPRSDTTARRARQRENFRFFGPPVGLFFVIGRDMGAGQHAHLGMFMQSVALAAEARGLGTCMQEIWAMLRPSLARHFGLSDGEIVYSGMALGHSDRAGAVNGLCTERAPVEAFAGFRGFDGETG